MSEEIEISKIAAELISRQIEGILDAASKTVSKVTTSLRGRIRRSYSSYISTLYRKHSVCKTLIYRETPHPLIEFYEPLDLMNDDLKLKSPGIIALATLKRPILITGTGGCGKSTMMKALLLDTIITQQLIPIFIELRYLEDSKVSLLEHISQNMRLNRLNLPSDFINNALFRGGYALLLDGLDELSEKNYGRISEEIQLLTQTSPDNVYIVTSRLGTDFTSWASFIELKIAPLNLKKACNLTNRLKIDVKLKKRFIKDLRGGLFEKHSTFFENPLLLCIMLLTYQDSASIPGELHNFYALAFDALYFRHDALKEGFSRPTKTGLPIDKSRLLMSTFSLVTYFKEKTVFTETEIRDYLKKAISLACITVDPSDFLADMISAFCMLLKDGMLYTFTHRSFQEYFAALYLIQARENQQKMICDQFISRLDKDHTLDLAHGMNPDLIETLVIIPFLEKVRHKTKYKGTVSRPCFLRYLSLFTNEIMLVNQGKDFLYMLSPQTHENNSIKWFIRRRFNLELNRVKKSANHKQAKDRLISYLMTLKKKKMNISVLSKNPEFCQYLFDYSSYFKKEFKALMKLLDILKSRHEQQVTSFDNLLKD